ncbi:hypothetical protein TeGR_g14672 [Tetraparma gracilis]|uniref:Heat shock protein 70 n=1 Tax=Tetraparma gracilis TaxID=2962635 RepID=A0ABQ6MMB1_9STRA|nr:hypothetical protein TeGR_g14672 [Tetraparma gracilis]
MSKAVVYRGGESEYYGDVKITHVTVRDEVTEIKYKAFYRCKGLTNLSFLEGSGVMTIGEEAFEDSGIITLLGMERVRKIGKCAFYACKDLRSIEGLGCEEMDHGCFMFCALLQSMKGWPASLTVIPSDCFWQCSGMTRVDCDLSRVTSIRRDSDGWHAFAGCTSLLPPSLSHPKADPAAVLAFLKRKSILERAPIAFLCSLKRAQSNFYNRTGDPCGASRRIIMQFAGLLPIARFIRAYACFPTKKQQTFSTAVDNQPQVQIKCLQGEREMSADNKLMGQFDLTDIPPAPRGVPQIEVSFDIDADGILNVSARDKGTGREQNIVIQSSGGLSDDDIEKMVRDAESNAEADAQRKEGIELKNEIDSMTYSTEKSLKEHADKIPQDVKDEVEKAIKEAGEAKDGDNFELIKEKRDALNAATSKIGQAIYGQGQSAEGGEEKKEEETVDAEFTDKDDKKEAK